MPGYVPITGGGTLTRTNIAQINSNFAAVTMPDLWVKPQGPNASNTNPGTFEAPLATMSGTAQYLKPGMTIGLLGVLFENWAPGPVCDITIVGMGNKPRQATSNGVPIGGGATWLNATHNGTPTATSLLRIGGASTDTGLSQGWKLQNLYFNNAATGSATADVELQRGDGAGVDVGRDASHAQFIGCVFTGTNHGILNQGGASFVTVDGCEFYNFAAGTDTAIAYGTATSVALPLQWQIKNSVFFNNVRHIVHPFSSATIYGNTFGFIGSTITTTIIYDATSGKNNSIWNNKVQCASDAVGITAAVVLGTADSWGPQFYTDVTEYGDPAS